MKKTFITFQFLQTVFLIFSIILLFNNCEKNGINDNQTKIIEKNSIDYGISTSELKNSKFFNNYEEQYALKYNKSKSNNSISEELEKMLDLEKAYYKNEKKLEILNVPVKNLNSFKRNLFSFTANNITNTFFITYPNIKSSRVFFISDLDGNLIQQVTIQDNGVGIIKKYNNQNKYSSKETSCDRTIYMSCSSGNHSFNDPEHVWECNYWTDISSGSPPQVFTASTPDCGGGGEDGGFGDGFDGGPSSGYDGSGGGSGGSSSTVLTPQQILIGHLFTTNDVYDWINNPNNSNLVEEINALGEANNWSFEIRDFIDNAIRALLNGFEVDFENKIINGLTGKAKCVYNKLSGNDLMNKTIQRFNKNNQVNLVLKYGSMVSSGASGETTYGSPITITLNQSHIDNRPSLYTALVIFHEAIHAEIFRKIITRSQMQFTPPNIYTLPDGSRANFPTLFDYYNEFPSNPQHNFMADYYRNAIEQGLRDYALIIGKTYPDQLYKDLSWGGLQGTKSWDKMFSDPTFTLAEQQRILKTINDFIKTGSNECN